MNREPEFYQEPNSGMILEKLGCCTGECGSGLQKLTPHTSEEAQKGGLPSEKHLPVVETGSGAVNVKVGSVFHPMEEAHSIQWVMLQTERGFQRMELNPGSEPMARFCLSEGDKPVAVFAYCNLHGLWKESL